MSALLRFGTKLGHTVIYRNSRQSAAIGAARLVIVNVRSAKVLRLQKELSRMPLLSVIEAINARLRISRPPASSGQDPLYDSASKTIPIEVQVQADLDDFVVRFASRSHSESQIEGGRPFLLVSGEVGAGKTHVIRQLASALHTNGLLRKGHVVCTDYESLVASYIGQTKIKTRATCNAALDGVLIVDDGLFALSGDSKSFRQEALDELVAFAAEHKNSILIVLESPSWRLTKQIEARCDVEQYIGATIHCPSPNIRRHCEFLHMFSNQICLSLPDNMEDVVRPWIEACRSVKFWKNIWAMKSLVDQGCKARDRRLKSVPSSKFLKIEAVDLIEAMERENLLPKSISSAFIDDLRRKISS